MPDGVTLIDLRHLGRDGAIAAGLIRSQMAGILIDPGPSSTLQVLWHQLGKCDVALRDIQAIFLTHIHLDHAGAAGVLVRENRKLKVYCHRRGITHLVDPKRLLNSANRVFGSETQRLWGDMLPVPIDNLVPLDGGEKIDVAGISLDVVYTPGHAWHHVTYFNQESGVAFVGDAAGNRSQCDTYVVPTTPPPDIDLDVWRDSLAAIRDLNPDRLFMTHFGLADDVPGHLDQFWSRLQDWNHRVRSSLTDDKTDAARACEFAESVAQEFPEAFANSTLAECIRGSDLETSWYGLARYWRKHTDI